MEKVAVGEGRLEEVVVRQLVDLGGGQPALVQQRLREAGQQVVLRPLEAVLLPGLRKQAEQCRHDPCTTEAEDTRQHRTRADL
mmetsp:Transcript_84725/g.123998  ORF Transcript_84725/g.123998 Transcript_84725/m.123998 type:complete len:83 (+) Transcript_84725:74-322(+)